MTDPVRHWATSRPDAPALVTGDATWTWADLDARVAAVAASLADGPDRVAVRAETSPTLVVWVLAALRARRLLIPLSTRWPDAAVDAALARLGVGLTEITDAPPAPASVAPDLDTDRPWTVVHTSGSTGAPKPIVHTVDNHLESAAGVVAHLGLRAGDRWLLDLPLYHVGGLGVVVRCALAGAALAVPPRAMPAHERVARLRPTHASFVATQLLRLLDADADLGSLRAVLLGGSAIPPGLVDRARQSRRAGLGLVRADGNDLHRDRGRARRRRFHVGPRAAGPQGSRLVPKARSRSAVRAWALCWRDGAFQPLGPWYPTGDLGTLDDQGRLTVTGRRDLQFVSGGENVRPEAIEAALHALHAVAEAVVVPVSDPEFGQRPVAFVRSAPGHTFDPAALADAVRQSLAGFMVPAAFHDWGGAGGMKPDRPALARRAEESGVRNEDAQPDPDS